MSSSISRLPLLDRIYRDYLKSESSADFVSQTSRHYTIETLMRLGQYGQRVTRRAAVLALGMMGDMRCNHVLGCALLDQDRAVRLISENSIRSIWMRDGDPGTQRKLQVISRLLDADDFAVAYDKATLIIERTPGVAEAWHQRGVAAYGLELIKDSVNDCHQALELNPYHFPAAIGMANCFLEMNDASSALACFRRALKLHPGLDAVRVQAEFLQRSIEGK